MTVKPFQTLAAFLTQHPMRQHSSRVLSKYFPVITDSVAAYVADAFLRDVGMAASVADAFLRDAGISVSVANATIQDVPTGPVIGLSGISLSFASTAVGGTRDLTIVITNDGSADLIITSLTPTGDFAVASITA
jgi:hypothetical protein